MGDQNFWLWFGKLVVTSTAMVYMPFLIKLTCNLNVLTFRLC